MQHLERALVTLTIAGWIPSLACGGSADPADGGAFTGIATLDSGEEGLGETETDTGDGTSTGGEETGDEGGSTSTTDDSTTGDSTTGGSTTGGSTTGGSTTGGSTTGGSTTGDTGGTSAGTGSGGDPNEDGWESIDVGTNEDLVAVDFADDQHGWVVGTGQVLLATTDGGQTWKSQEDGFWTSTSNTKQVQAHALDPGPAWGQYHLLDVHAVSSSVVWISSIGPLAKPISLDPAHLTAVFVTSDAGESWKRLTLATNFQAWGIFGFDTQTARVATIGSSDHPDSDIYSISSGASQASVPMTFMGLRDLQFVDAQTGFAVGFGVARSDDAGASWDATSAPAGSYWAIDFVDADHGWVVGEGGDIIATVDGGSSWQAQDAGTNTDLYGVSFASPNEGFAVGNQGVVLHTDDGGATWSPEDSGTAQWINGVVALSGTQAWATADGGELLHRVP